ncbi:MAG: F0F1 ATP synthase subunit A [Flavobacteriales bacterium]
MAFASGSEGGKKEFKAGEVILHHVLDAHEIHFFTLGEGTERETHFSMPLPIILYSPEKGLEFFGSHKFHADHNIVESHADPIAVEQNGEHHTPQHAHDPIPVYNGYALYHEKIYMTDEHGNLTFDEHGHPTNAQPLDFSITKTVFGLGLAMAILLLVMLTVAKGYKKRGLGAPKGIQSFIEPLVIFIRDEVAKPSIGEKHYKRFMPFLLTIFFFILICNVVGLVPFIGGFNITGNISVALVLALLTFLVTIFSGKKDYWMHLVWTPGVPAWLKLPVPLMFIIEFIGVVSKPIVLCLRLFANITAGHIIILSFVSLIFIFGEKFGTGAGYGVSVLSVAFSVFMNVMELLVAFLQAYVFTLLASVYFGQAVEEHAHDHGHEHEAAHAH